MRGRRCVPSGQLGKADGGDALTNRAVDPVRQAIEGGRQGCLRTLRTVDRTHRDGVGCLGQGDATVRAASAEHPAGAGEFGEQPRKIGRGDPPPGGDLSRRSAVRPAVGELHEGFEAILLGPIHDKHNHQYIESYSPMLKAAAKQG